MITEKLNGEEVVEHSMYRNKRHSTIHRKITEAKMMQLNSAMFNIKYYTIQHIDDTANT